MLLARDIGATFWPCTGCFKKVAPLKLWWNLNIKINLQKLVDICGYELPTNLQNFMQKDLTKVKIFWKVLGGGLLFLKHLVLVWLWITVAGKWFPLKKLVLMVLLGMRKRQQKAAHQSLVDLDMASSHDRVLIRWIVSSHYVMMKWYDSESVRKLHLANLSVILFYSLVFLYQNLN